MIALRGMHEQLRPYAEYAHQLAEAYGIHPTVTSVKRTWEKQLELWNNFQRCKAEGKYPWAEGCRYPANQPGDSSHNYGLSWDSWVPAGDMPLWIAIRRYVGFRVPDHDPIHAEYPEWRSVLV